jgi:hypothetical protein
MKFLAGVVVTILVVWEPEWYELGVLVILAGVFWRPLDRMTRSLNMDLEGWRLERALSRSLHVDADARVAHRLLVGD